MCLISWERMQQGTHIAFFGGIWGVRKGGSRRAIFGHKRFSLVFFPALTISRTPSGIEISGQFQVQVCLVTERAVS